MSGLSAVLFAVCTSDPIAWPLKEILLSVLER